MKRFLSIIGCIFLLILAVAAYRWFTIPTVGGIPFADLSPQEQAKRRADARHLTDQVGALAKAAGKHEKVPFVVMASQDQLNTLLQDRLHTEQFPINHLRVGLQPNQLTAQGDVRYNGFEAPASLTGTILAQQGEMSFQVNSLTIAGFPAPAKIRRKIESSVTRGLEKLIQGGRRGHVNAVTIGESSLTIRGVTD